MTLIPVKPLTYSIRESVTTKYEFSHAYNRMAERESPIPEASGCASQGVRRGLGKVGVHSSGAEAVETEFRAGHALARTSARLRK